MAPPSETTWLPELGADFDGRVILPGDDRYDAARTVAARGIDRRPAAIVRPTDAAQVARAVTVAREAGLELAVRSGGHSGAGHGVTEGGVVIDLSDMTALEVDPAGRTAWTQTGLTTGAYTEAVATHGLATGFGDTGAVGIGGLTLGGGVGFLSRRHGLTVDHLLAAEVVTADGQVRHVDEETHPDLFWALRGGGGNLGVATRFRFRLHEVGTVLGGLLVLPATADVVAGFVAEADAAPESLSTVAYVMPAAPMPFVPEEHRGAPVLMVHVCHVGPSGEGERVVDRFRALATPLADMVRPMPYAEMFTPQEQGPPMYFRARTMFADTVGREDAATMLEWLAASSAPMRVAQLRVLGGAVARVPADATAYAHRARRVMVNLGVGFPDLSEAAVHEEWVAGFAAALGQGDGHAYVNFLADEGADRVRAAYPGNTWDRLRAVKTRYDPGNLFRLNQNVPPTTVGD